MKVWGVPTELGILLGVIFAAIVGLVMGKLAIRRQGIYFTMITMALSQMLFFVFCRRRLRVEKTDCNRFRVGPCLGPLI